MLREQQQSKLADQLAQCEIVFKCARSIGVQNPFASKRARAVEEIQANTFLDTTLVEAFRYLQSDELSFCVIPPAQPRVVRDATAMLMRASSTATLHLPKQKQILRMTGEHRLFNAILGYIQEQGLGWSLNDLPSGEQFISHVTKAFWAIGPKV